MNEAQVSMPFSTDECFIELTDKDKTAEISGYICMVKAASNVGEGGKYRLLKFAVSNSNKKVMCIMWGQPLIDRYLNDIVVNKRVHINGFHCKINNISYSMEGEGYVPFDLVIQPNTIVTYYGMYEPNIPCVVEPQPQAVTFENINIAQGLVFIEGFIKTQFTVVPSRYQNVSYGCGSITNGTFKITVNVTNFVPNEELQRGSAVTVLGTVDNNNGPLSLICRDMSCITLREGAPQMPHADILQGGRTLRRRVPVN